MPPPDGDVNRGTTVLIFYWTLFAVEVIFVSLRFYARQKTHALGLDDWTIAIALVRRPRSNLARVADLMH